MGRAVLTAEGSGELVLAVGQQLAVSVHFPCRRRILYSTSPTCLLLGWNHVIITYLSWCSIAHRASLPAWPASYYSTAVTVWSLALSWMDTDPDVVRPKLPAVQSATLLLVPPDY